MGIRVERIRSGYDLRLLTMKHASQKHRPSTSLLRYPAMLWAVTFPLLIVTGCVGVTPPSIPSKMFVTKDSAALSKGAEPTPCDTFTYGEHPVVVIEGFAHVPEATLEILTNETVISRRTIPLNSSKADKTHSNSQTDSLARAKIDLGAMSPGVYDLDLRTNGVVTAVFSFKVTLPAWLENQRNEIEAQRVKLQRLVEEVKVLNAEIERERAALDQSNEAKVKAFNDKIAHHNEAVQKAREAREQYDSSVQKYNDRLKAMHIPLTPSH